MPGLPTIAAEDTADQACARLQAAGWGRVGAGDWAWAFADPSGALAARVTPFDPGYRMFAAACLDWPSNRWLPHVLEIRPLRRDGYIVLMQRLWPAEEAAASAFCAALGIANETGKPPPIAGPAVSADDPDLAVARARIRALLADSAARYRQWTVCDIHEGNVMVDAAGQLKLIDPLGVGGWKIVEALRQGQIDLLSDFPRDQLEDFLTIPYFGPGREGEADRDELLGFVARLSGGA
jgi:hypothetical protein